jgi:hypothetical protein
MEFFYIFLACLASIGLALCCSEESCQASHELLAVSVATEETDGYKRYIRSLKQFNYNYEVGKCH